MHNKNPLPSVDHGVDIIGDEWEDSEEEPEMPKMEYEKKYVPEHPYCTNWPVTNRKEKKDEDI